MPPRILIWSDSDRDWGPKLNSIKPDPSAGRDERAHFTYLKRFDSQLQTMANVTEAISQGFLKLTRFDAEKVEPNLNPLYQHSYDWWVHCKVMGKRSMKLLPYGMCRCRSSQDNYSSGPDHRATTVQCTARTGSTSFTSGTLHCTRCTKCVMRTARSSARV